MHKGGGSDEAREQQVGVGEGGVFSTSPSHRGLDTILKLWCETKSYELNNVQKCVLGARCGLVDAV